MFILFTYFIPHLSHKKYISNTKNFYQHGQGSGGVRERMEKNVLSRSYHASRPQIHLLSQDIYLILKKHNQVLITGQSSIGLKH